MSNPFMMKNTQELTSIPILIFAKLPRENFVKTRLSTSILTSFEILQLYKAFLHDTIEQSAKSNITSIYMSITDNNDLKGPFLSDLDFFKSTKINHQEKLQINYHKQPDGDFGDRMKSAIEWTFNLGYNRVIILGADSPHLQPIIINNAIRELKKYDVVLGPSAEAGIYLIGLNKGFDLQNFSKIFQGAELSDFAKEVESQSLSLSILQDLIDVDQEADLVGLISWLESVQIQSNQEKNQSIPSKYEIPVHTKLIIDKLNLKIDIDEMNNRNKKLSRTI